MGMVLKQWDLFVAAPSGCLASPPQWGWRQNPGLAAKLSMLCFCDGQQPLGWHNPAVGAEKPGTPPFVMWVFQKKKRQTANIFCFMLQCFAPSLDRGSSTGEIGQALAPVGA